METALDGFIATELDDVLDYQRLNELVEFQRKNNPALKGKTLADIAESCDSCETTLKGILKGRNKNPRVGTLVRLLKSIGGGSIDRLVGLAPPRDFRAEEAVYDKTLVETLQARLEAKQERIEEYKEQVATLETENQRVRKLYLKAREDFSSATEKCSQIDEYRKRIVRFRRALIVFVVLTLMFSLILLYLILDVSNPHAGRIGEVIWR